MSSTVNQLQLLQQNLQQVQLQIQQMQNELVELTSADSELSSTPQAYKIVGKLMIASPKEELKQEISQKKETITLRIKTFEQQEERLKKDVEAQQKLVMKEMQK